ncbi:MAG: SapC family protein [Proteobacteria bacterium]|nr:SapC family protein [Pseudomonadota bacterium]
MSEKASSKGSNISLEVPKGSMFLYQKPELLTVEEHGALGFVTPSNPYGFAKKATTIPLVASEIASAQKHYPVIFSNPENATPHAIVSVLKDENMFVDKTGNWVDMHYIPSYVRRHPFAIASGDNDQLAVVIDRSSVTISEKPDHPFFNEGALTEQTQLMVDFCGQFEAERRRTIEFCKRLKELELLKLQEVNVGQGDSEKQLASYYAVDVKKLEALEPDTLTELHKNGYLSFIFAHLFSLENWPRLLDRRQLMLTANQA